MFFFLFFLITAFILVHRDTEMWQNICFMTFHCIYLLEVSDRIGGISFFSKHFSNYNTFQGLKFSISIQPLLTTVDLFSRKTAFLYFLSCIFSKKHSNLASEHTYRMFEELATSERKVFWTLQFNLFSFMGLFFKTLHCFYKTNGSCKKTYNLFLISVLVLFVCYPGS